MNIEVLFCLKEEARIIPIQILRNEPEAMETMETSSPAEETETIGKESQIHFGLELNFGHFKNVWHVRNV